MQFKFFQVPLCDPAQAEDELNRFLRGHRTGHIERELVNRDGQAVWAFCVEYLDGKAKEREEPRGGKVDYREILSPEDFAVFAELRKLRKQIAEADGVPVYAVFTNEQLAEMARRRVSSEEEMKEIDGVGEAKSGKYAAAFLDILARMTAEQPS